MDLHGPEGLRSLKVEKSDACYAKAEIGVRWSDIGVREESDRSEIESDRSEMESDRT